MYLYSNIIGTFVFNQNIQIREKILFKESELKKNFDLMQKGAQLETEKEFLVKFKNIVNLREDPDEKVLEKVFNILKEFKKEFYGNNLYLTRTHIRETVMEDLLIVQSSCSIEEINKSINLLVKRLREWYSYVLPEVEEKLEGHPAFVEVILKKSRNELIKELCIKNSMGLDIHKIDIDSILDLAKAVSMLMKEKENKERYLETAMKKNCPNITEVAGYLIGAKLISIAGTLRSLVMMPSSTIQLLGAEKALFRHMLNKNSKPPKHGIIHEHPLLQRVKKDQKGKAARALSDKILLAAKIDFFKGQFIGDKLRKELDEKFKEKSK